MTRVRLNLSPLRRYRARVVQDVKLMNGQHSARIIPAWQNTFWAFQRRRFERNAAGGGEWPPLAESTLRGDPPGRRGILWVGGAIHGAMTPGAPGNIVVKVRRGQSVSVRLGIGGPARHPDSGLSIGEMARLHSDGGPNRPPRKVMGPPDDTVKRSLRETVRRVLSATTRGWR